ncbi:hypothetical protein [Actinoplanes friuliensis]|uniref:Uncharacterized protein n=1 Tax=Actinoplanes friuliensis DSM 7358 TaxID=1246995 RepID=U5W529_9ACTN|nr:hypothetical protein [Actinoplanes friuliensis]AGZ44112.1 hypothetical protein AFR_29255 [Actinoplanes friuliensis DSM 7358]
MSRGVRATAVLRAGWGLTLLLVPGRLAPGVVPAGVVPAARVLGVRHVVQAAASVVAPTGTVAVLGIVVDAVHTGSCLVLAAAAPRWRRAALLDAVIEGGLTAAAWGAIRAARRG